VRNLQRRVGRLESEKVVEDDFQLAFVDLDLPDGRMFYKGKPVIIRPCAFSLVIHKHARRKIDA